MAYIHTAIDNIFVDNYVQLFLCTFLNILQANFPLKISNRNNRKNYWIKQGIKMSSKHKSSLYTSENSSDPTPKAPCVKYGTVDS
jgi:hypothetical protein